MSEKKTFDQSDFFTASLAEKGVRLDLVTPEGEATEKWIEIQGIDSAAYRQANTLLQRELVENIKNVRVGKDSKDELSVEEVKTLEAANQLSITRVIASVVKCWNFDQELTLENVVTFLVNAPQIQDEIDRLINNRKRFFAMARNN